MVWQAMQAGAQLAGVHGKRGERRLSASRRGVAWGGGTALALAPVGSCRIGDCLVLCK